MKEEYIELRKDVLISTQRALWGMIYPEVRSVAVGFSDGILHLIYYLDREPNEDDFEIISEVTTEILADFSSSVFNSLKENCIYSKDLIKNLPNLDSWVYIRREMET